LHIRSRAEDSQQNEHQLIKQTVFMVSDNNRKFTNDDDDDDDDDNYNSTAID